MTTQAFRQGLYAASFLELRRNLARRVDGMDHEQRENDQNGRLRDVEILEHCCQPVEATFPGQDRADKHHVPPHEQREEQAAAAADDFMRELSPRRCRN